MATSRQRWAARMIKWAGKGATATLQRSHTLKAGPRPTNSLIAGAASGGAAVLVLSSPAGLSGSITRGCQLTVAAAVYTVQQDAAVADGAVTVQIAPPLAAPVTAGTAVAITRPFGEETYSAAKRAEEQIDLPNRAAVTAAAVRLAIEGQPTPEEGQVLVLEGLARKIVKRANLGAGAEPDCWVVWLDREAA